MGRTGVFITSAKGTAMRTFLILLAALALTLSACGTDTATTDDAAATPSVAGATTERSDDEAAIAAALDDITMACQDADRDRLRDHVADELHEPLRDRDRDQLFHTDTDATITLLSRTIEVDGDTATVTTVHEVTIDGETTEVERTWEFERTDDGTWVLTELPDCPFRD